MELHRRHQNLDEERQECPRSPGHYENLEVQPRSQACLLQVIVSQLIKSLLSIKFEAGSHLEQAESIPKRVRLDSVLVDSIELLLSFGRTTAVNLSLG